MNRRIDDGQRPLPFTSGMPAARRKPAKRWRLADGSIARICPVCKCHERAPCTVLLDDGESYGHCVPAGVHGRRVCGACKQIALPFAKAHP